MHSWAVIYLIRQLLTNQTIKALQLIRVYTKFQIKIRFKFKLKYYLIWQNALPVNYQADDLLLHFNIVVTS